MKEKEISDICLVYKCNKTPVTHLAYCGIDGLGEKLPLSAPTQSCLDLGQAFSPLEHLSFDLPAIKPLAHALLLHSLQDGTNSPAGHLDCLGSPARQLL